MFHGSIPSDMQRILWGILKDWDCKNLYIGCSGNFTIERVVAPYEKFKLFSNDVTVYSSILGNYFADVPMNIGINKEKYPTEFDWLEKYLTTPEDLVTSMLIVGSFIAFYKNYGANVYYTKQIDAYKLQWNKLFTNGKAKLLELKDKMRLEQYYEGDVIDFVDSMPQEDGFVCFPPFFVGDYEKMFEAMQDLLTWTPPEYGNLDEARKEELFKKIMEKKYWVIGINYEDEFLKNYLSGMTKTTNRGMPIYIYSNTLTGKKVVLPNQKVVEVKIPRLFRGGVIGDKIELAYVNTEEFQTLRSEYMNAHIVPGAATRAFGVLVDGILIGVYAVVMADGALNMGNKIEPPNAYLLSDFPVAPTDYGRLSKLVLYAALSKESKFLVERTFNRRINSLTTTAFSKRNSSMKYRGMFKLMNKSKMDEPKKKVDGDKAGYYTQNKLNYGAKMGEWTLQEGFDLWKKKFGQVGGKVENE